MDPTNTAAMTGSASVPFLPGMYINKQTWLYKQHEGFKRIKGGRPSASATGVSYSSPFPSPNNNNVFSSGGLETESFNPLEQQHHQNRPSTAGQPKRQQKPQQQRNNNTNPLIFLDGPTSPVIANKRPSTAGSYGRSESAPSLSINSPIRIQPPTIGGGGGGVVPKFVYNDKKVCRFYGYLAQERLWDKDSALGQPTVETNMIRYLTILVYLIDDTIEIQEEKQTNTGIQGGSFFRRGILMKDDEDGVPLSLRDLFPGSLISALGIQMFITDADSFTRDHYKNNYNVDLAPAMKRPSPAREDLGVQYAMGNGAVAPPKSSHFASYSQEYMNKKEGLEKTYRFLHSEGRVLRFEGLEMEAVDAAGGIPEEGATLLVPILTRRIVISYYLTDSSIEVQLDAKKTAACGHAGPGAMSGHQENNLLLRKSRLPRNWRETRKGRAPIYYEMSDFICGSTVDIYGRSYFLTSCDQFTSDSYITMGVVQKPVAVALLEKKKIVHLIPQLGDGFLPIGGPEDTLGTVYGMPKPKRDVKKIQRNQNRQLRCKTKLISDRLNDQQRIFNLTFYLEDDTIQIYEEDIRNSGIKGGTFLKRGRYMNELPPDDGEPRYFQPTDIFLSNVISFNGSEMQIIEMDNMSLRFCEAFPDEFPMSDIFEIIHRLLQTSVDEKIDVRRVFIQGDPRRAGRLSKGAFVDLLDSSGLSGQLSDQELLTLMRRFQHGVEPNVVYYYDELCDLFSHVYSVHNPSSLQHIRRGSFGRNREKETNLSSLFLLARSNTTQWRRILRRDQHASDGIITMQHLCQAFSKYAVVITPNAKSILAERYAAVKEKVAPFFKVK